MPLVDYLDKGASIDAEAPCLTDSEQTLSYGDVRALSFRVARALVRAGISPGEKVAILAHNDIVAFSCVFGISRAAAVWCPVNPRNEAAENRDFLALVHCKCLLFEEVFSPLVARIAPELPQLTTLVCLDADTPYASSLNRWTADLDDAALDVAPVDDIVMIAGTGGTTGRPKGVMLTDRNLEVMSATTLMSYPFEGTPTYLAVAPLTHAAGVLCFPVMARGGSIVVMSRPDLGALVAAIQAQRITHLFLPPTLIYMLLAHPDLDTADLSSLQCLWYGAAPMSVARLEEAIERIGPVLGQLYGQTEAPMMIATLSPSEHLLPDGSLARERLSSVGRPSPLVQVVILTDEGATAARGERGEIAIKSSLVMAGYFEDPAATAAATHDGWHRTGDIGFLDAEGFLHIVDRKKDMIISGGFNVYSAEVEQALMQLPAIRDCAVVGLPDEKWGERVTAIVELHPDTFLDIDEARAHVKAQIGSTKAPKQIEIWPELPRSKVGKVLKAEVRSRLLARS